MITATYVIIKPITVTTVHEVKVTAIATLATISNVTLTVGVGYNHQYI